MKGLMICILATIEVLGVIFYMDATQGRLPGARCRCGPCREDRRKAMIPDHQASYSVEFHGTPLKQDIRGS